MSHVRLRLGLDWSVRLDNGTYKPSLAFVQGKEEKPLKWICDSKCGGSSLDCRDRLSDSNLLTTHCFKWCRGIGNESVCPQNQQPHSLIEEYAPEPRIIAQICDT